MQGDTRAPDRLADPPSWLTVVGWGSDGLHRRRTTISRTRGAPGDIEPSTGRPSSVGPLLLLRPGGPFYPTDMPCTVDVATQEQPEPGPDRLSIQARLRGETVIWSNPMYPDLDGRPIEEVRFRLEQYLGEVERAYAALKGHTLGQ